MAVRQTGGVRRSKRRLTEAKAGIIGIAVLALLCAIDLISGRKVGIEGSFVLAPLIVALSGSVRATALISLLAILAVIAIGPEQSSTDVLLTKAAIVVASGPLAIGLAYRQGNFRLEAERAMLLEQVANVGDRTISLSETLDDLVGILLEDFADGCSIQVIEGEGLRLLIDAGVPEERKEMPWPANQQAGTSSLYIPLVARDRTLGILTLRRSGGEVFSIRDSRLAASLANRTARALDNAGLFDEFDSLNRRLDTVISLLDEGVMMLNPRGRFLFASEATCHILGLDPSSKNRERDIEARTADFGVELEDGTYVGTLSERIDHALEQNLEWDGIIRLMDVENRSQRWLRVRSKPILSNRGELLWFVLTLEDVDAVKNQEVTATILGDIARITAEDEGREIYQSLAEVVTPAFADACWIYLPSENGYLDGAGIANHDPERRAAMVELNRHFPVRMDEQLRVVESQRRGTSALFEIDAEVLRESARSPEHFELMERIGNRSALVVPLRDGPEIVGVMAFGNRSGSRAFSDLDRTTAEEIGRRCAEVINRERRAQENMEVAKILEDDLQPRALPPIPGIETAEMFRSTTRLTEVGGDFFEAVETSNHWFLLIGDVVGRGAAASGLSLESRDIFRVALELTEEPMRAFESLDRRLRERNRDEQVTALIVRITKADPGLLSIWSAGHPPPLLCLPADECGEIEGSGPIIGLDLPGGWPEVKVEWTPGSMLALYTDGVSETRRPDGEMIGSRAIGMMLPGHETARDVASAVGDELDNHWRQGGGRSDDAALVVLRRLENDESGVIT